MAVDENDIRCSCGCEPGNPCKNVFTMTFDSDGGFPPIQTVQVEFGDIPGSPNTPTKHGHDFLCWFRYKPDRTEEQFNPENPYQYNGDTTFIAKWNADDSKKCTVKFDTQQSDVANPDDVQLPWGHIMADNLPSVSKAGLEFLGWFTKKVNGQKVDELTRVNGDVTFYAKWKVQICTVTFKSDGVVVETRKVEYGQEGGPVPLINAKIGHDFNGWKKSDGGNYNPDDQITEDIEVTVDWTPTQYTISYELNEHGTLPSGFKQFYTINDEFSIRSPTADTGYTFLGWTYSGQQTPQQIVNIHTGTIGNKTFYANWKKKEYTITFQTNEECFGPYTIEWEQEIGEAVGGELPTPNGKRGYTFIGWERNGTLVYDTDIYTTDDNTTFTPRWEPNKYTLTLDSNEGLPATYEIEVEYDKPINIEGCTPTRTGYVFDGWFNEDGGTEIRNGDAWEEVQDLTCYAHWNPITYTVVYNVNGGTGGSTDSSEHIYDEFKCLNENGFIREYAVSFNLNAPVGETPTPTSISNQSCTWQFEGWGIQSNGAKIYQDKQSVVNLADTQNQTVNLYAKWIPGEITLPPLPEIAGWTATGWFSNSTPAVKIGMGGDKYSATEDKTLKVIWERKRYTITLDSAGGVPPMKTMTVQYKLEVGTLPEPPIKVGYEHMGWFDSENSKLERTTKYIWNYDKTYYSQWEPEKIRVTFKKNNGAADVVLGDQIPASDILRANQAFTIPPDLNSIEKTDHEFLGWASSPNAIEAEYGGKAKPNIVSFNRDMTLYAVWEYTKCKVYFTTAIGNLAMPSSSQQDDGGQFIVITKGNPINDNMPTCSKGEDGEDMEFLGWFTQPIGGTIVTAQTPIMSDCKLFSQWTSKDAMAAYQARTTSNLDEYINELLKKIPGLDLDVDPETGEKIDPAEAKRQQMIQHFADGTAYKLDNAGLHRVHSERDYRINMYFYTDGSSESGLRHKRWEKNSWTRVNCSSFSMSRFSTTKWEDENGQQYFIVPLFPMIDMRNKTWRSYIYPADDVPMVAPAPGSGGSAPAMGIGSELVPVWSKEGKTSPGWVLMDMTKSQGWGKSMELGTTIHHTKKTSDGITFHPDVTYFNYLVEPSEENCKVRWIYLNTDLLWNSSYSFWADFAPKNNADSVPVSDEIKRVF